MRVVVIGLVLLFAVFTFLGALEPTRTTSDSAATAPVQ